VRAAGLEVHAGYANDADSLRKIEQLDIPKFDTDNLRLALQFRRGLDG
jgi:hypothetical protein